MENDHTTQESVAGMIPPGDVQGFPLGGDPAEAPPAADDARRIPSGGKAGIMPVPSAEGELPAQPADETEAAVQASFRAVMAEAAALRGRYPGFDLGAALADRRFAAVLVSLQRAGAPDPVRLAYEGVYHERLTRDVVRAAVERTAAGLAESIRSGTLRPAENGGGAAAGAHIDPAALSPQQRRDIRDRVMRGERVTF